MVQILTIYPWRFNGKEYDQETGNYYYGARYYDPKLSIWLSVDPMSSERSWLTPYNFVQNNPIMLTDPTGMLDGWVEGEDGAMTYDPKVHSQQDLKDQGKSGTYRGEEGSALDENTGEAVYYNPDGSTTRKSNRLAESTITPNGGYQTSNPSIGSNNNTGYTYNDRDLAIRSSVLSTDNTIATYLRMMESHGQFFILNGHDYWMTYGHTGGNMLLMDKYLAMQGLVSYGPGRSNSVRGLNMSLPGGGSSSTTVNPSSQLLLPQRSSVPRNSWNAFLKKK